MIPSVEVLESIPSRHSARISALLSDCFRASVARRSDHNDRFCSQADAWRHVLALDPEEDIVVGFATIYRRRITWMGRTIGLGGLGDVCTERLWRHRGVATAVVRAAMAELQRTDDQLAYLCAAVNDAGIVHLYGQVGFVPLGRPHTYEGRSGKRYGDDDGMIAPVGTNDVFDEVMRSDEALHIGRGNW